MDPTSNRRDGVREYWLVDLEAKRIEVLALRDATYETIASGEGGTPVGGRVLEGFSVRPGDIF